MTEKTMRALGLLDPKESLTERIRRECPEHLQLESVND